MADNGTIARPYARAAFDLARDNDDLATWAAALATAKDVLADGQAVRLLANPALSDDDKLGFLTDLFRSAGGKASVLGGGNTQGANFLKLLLEYGRVGVLPEIADHFEAMKAEVENTVDVIVTSASPLNAAQKKTIEAALKDRLGRNVNLSTEVEEELIGGAVIRAGDIVIDGSLRSRLMSLSNALIA